MKLLKLITILLAIIALSNTQAATMYNPDALAIDDFEENLYEVTNKDIGKLANLDNLKDLLIPQDQWRNIIATGDTELAHTLLDKLTSYLPKNELWDYIQAGLLRHENKFNDLIADHAYYNWSTFSTTSELLEIRTNPKYRNNLSVLTTWNYLFRDPPNVVITLEEAVERLELLSFDAKSKYNDRWLVASLRTKIALSKDYEILQTLIYHDNFHIAISAYYALSRLNPEDKAFAYISENLNRNESFEFHYMAGDIGSNDFISLAQASYDLFSDYLSEEQLKEIVENDLMIKSGKRTLTIRNNILAQQLLPYKTQQNTIMFILQDWELRKKLSSFNTTQLETLIKRRSVEEYMTDKLFSQEIVFAVTELSYTKNKLDDYDISDWIYSALKVHNNNAKRLVAFFLSGKNPDIKLEPIIDLLSHYKTWPRDWQDIKYQVLDIYEQPGFQERIEIYNMQQEIF